MNGKARFWVGGDAEDLLIGTWMLSKSTSIFLPSRVLQSQEPVLSKKLIKEKLPRGISF